MQVNFEAAHRGVLIERIIILRDDLWPPGAPLPQEAILPWVQEQHNHGLWLTLVREGDLAPEPDLRCDVGIYGNLAVGTQEVDDRARTCRFSLSFDPQEVRLARDRWRRLSLYALSFRELLDKQERDQ
jgi:hypothetical protein